MVLFRFYAKIIHGNQKRTNEQIERALSEVDEESEEGQKVVILFRAWSAKAGQSRGTGE